MKIKIDNESLSSKGHAVIFNGDYTTVVVCGQVAFRCKSAHDAAALSAVINALAIEMEIK